MDKQSVLSVEEVWEEKLERKTQKEKIEMVKKKGVRKCPDCHRGVLRKEKNGSRVCPSCGSRFP